MRLIMVKYKIGMCRTNVELFRCQSVGEKQCGNDSFKFGQFISGFYCFVIIDSQYGSPSLSGKIGVYRSDSRIVQSGGDRVGFFNLSVFVLDNVSTGSMDNAHFPKLYSGGGHSGFYSFSSCFCQNDAYPSVIDIMINRSGGIASSTYTGYQIIRVITSFFLHKLFFDFFADYGLQACHHVGIRMGTYC